MSKRRGFTGIFRAAVPAISVLLLAACSTQPGTIFKLFDLEEGKSVSTGSRQRVVLNTRPTATPRPGLVQPDRVVCAEPSPDVAIAVANSFGAGLSILGQGSGSVSATQAEGIAQLAERTVTVQLLRDQMYRACEAYANGAITGTTYSLITSKNNKTMVSLLLGETAGGAVGRELAVIGTSATAKARATMQGHKINSEAAKKALDDRNQAEADLEVANTDLAAAKAKNNGAGDQDGIDDAEKRKKDAERRIKEADKKLVAATEAASESSAKVDQIIRGGGIEGKPNAGVAKVLKDMQQQFLESDFLEDYVSTCLVELGLNSSQDKNSPIRIASKTAQELYTNYATIVMKFPDSKTDQENLEAARRDLDTAFIRANDTFLSKQCGNTLPDLMTQQQLNNHILASNKLDNEAIASLGNIFALCQTIEDSAQRDACQNTVTVIQMDTQLIRTKREDNLNAINLKRLALVSRELDIKAKKRAKEAAESMSELLAQCAKLSGADQITACQDKALDMASADKQTKPDPAPVEGVEKNELQQPG